MLTADGSDDSVDVDRAVMSRATRAVNGVSARIPRSLSLSILSVSAMPCSRIRFRRSNRTSCFCCRTAWESSRARMRLAFVTLVPSAALLLFVKEDYARNC